MGKKLTVTQIKKELGKLPNEALVDLICRLCKASEETEQQVNIFLGNDSFLAEALDKAKNKVRNEFFPKRGFGRLRLAEAKSAITAFKKICSDQEMVIDLQLYYVECGIEFTNEYGDINESFYNSMAGMYETAVKSLIKTKDSELIGRFKPRFEQAVYDASGIGWGFYDDLCDTFSELEE